VLGAKGVARSDQHAHPAASAHPARVNCPRFCPRRRFCPGGNREPDARQGPSLSLLSRRSPVCRCQVSFGSSPLLVYEMACTPASFAEVVELAWRGGGGGRSPCGPASPAALGPWSGPHLPGLGGVPGDPGTRATSWSFPIALRPTERSSGTAPAKERKDLLVWGAPDALRREIGRFAVGGDSRRHHEALGNDASARHDIWQPHELGQIVPPVRRELRHLLGGRTLARILLALLAAAWYKQLMATGRSHPWNPEWEIFTHETWAMGLCVGARQR